jgi:N-acetyl-anhydromuramyl-L-alanine amidase AmpD
MGAVGRITLHHTAEVPGMEGRDDAEVVRAIQRYHRDHLDWADIGYHWLVGRDGRVYEGREAGVQGAHAGGENNRHNLGIALLGEFTDALPPPAQLQAIQALLADRLALHGVPRTEVFGHRDLAPTECPGSMFYGWIKAHPA